jgi:hypothetical protein
VPGWGVVQAFFTSVCEAGEGQKSSIAAAQRVPYGTVPRPIAALKTIHNPPVVRSSVGGILPNSDPHKSLNSAKGFQFPVEVTILFTGGRASTLRQFSILKSMS